MTGSSPETVVRSLLEALGESSVDHDEVLAYFAPDASYWMNAWREPSVGTEGIRAELARQATLFQDLRIQIVRLVASGDAVFVERRDSMTIGGKPVTLHFAGEFVLDDELRIVQWRDWFDSGEVAAALGSAG